MPRVSITVTIEREEPEYREFQVEITGTAENWEVSSTPEEVEFTESEVARIEEALTDAEADDWDEDAYKTRKTEEA